MLNASSPAYLEHRIMYKLRQTDKAAIMKERFLLNTPAPGADQFPFHVEECGSGDAICILLHGFGEGGYVWYDFAARLHEKYRAIIVNFRGHGDYDEKYKRNYDIDTYYYDILSLISKYRINNISLIGHSLGASVALKIAWNVPYLVKNLVLVDFSLNTKPSVHENIMAQFHEQCDGFNSPAEYAAWISDRRPLTHPKMIPHIVDNALRETPDGRFILKVDPAIRGIIDNLSAHADDIKTILSDISCRTLLIRGQGSAILSKAESLDIVSLLKNGDLQEISGAGHAVMIDNPDEFSETVNRFLAGSRT